MPGFTSRIPRLTALLSFEAAARHRSLTAASRELGVTQAAISQQVRALEKELGVVLFVRHQRGLELTREGERLHRSAAMGFECIANAVEDIRVVGGPSFRIGVTSAIATFWLLPRLPRFRAQHPEIDVHIVASDLGFEAVADRADIGIGFGRGSWPGFRTAFLREGHAFPVCSPSYLLSRPQLMDVEQLPDEVLLVLDDNRVAALDWSLWFASFGVRNTNQRRIKFNSLPLLLQAACEGQGIALGWSLLTDDLLARGTLVRPLSASLRTPQAYYLAIAETNPRPEILIFRDWLLRQFPLLETEQDRSGVAIAPPGQCAC